MLTDPCAQDVTETVDAVRSRIERMSRARAQTLIETRSGVSSAVRSLMLQREWEAAIDLMVQQKVEQISFRQLMNFKMPRSGKTAVPPQSTWSATHIAVLLLTRLPSFSPTLKPSFTAMSHVPLLLMLAVLVVLFAVTRPELKERNRARQREAQRRLREKEEKQRQETAQRRVRSNRRRMREVGMASQRRIRGQDNGSQIRPRRPLLATRGCLKVGSLPAN